MNKLTERQSLIIEDLLNSDVPISAKQLSEKFNVSVRTIRYDLDNIDYWLKSKNIDMLKKPNIGIWINAGEKEKKFLINEINSLNFSARVLTKDERQKIILLELLRNVAPVTAESLADKLGVSRTTLIKDIKEIRIKLKKYGVNLIGRQRNGYILTGEENDIRNLISNVLLQSIDKSKLLEIIAETKIASNNKNDSIVIERLKDISDSIKIKDIKKAIKETRKTYDFWMPDSSYASLLVHLVIAMDRLIKGQKIKLSQDRILKLKKYNEYSIASLIAEKLSHKYNIKIPEAEVANITVHLISSNLRLEYLLNENIKDREKILVETVREMIESTKDYINIDSINYKKLETDLIAHLKITLKKLELGIVSENPLIEQIKVNFVDEFEKAKKMNKIFEKNIGICLPENEIGYLALHIAACRHISQQNKRKKVLVVCTTGKGSAKVLAARLRSTIPQLEIKDVVSMFELESCENLLTDVDFIISTVYLNNIKKPVLKISPIISNRELDKIKEYISGNSFDVVLKENKKENYILESVMNIIGKYIDVEDREKLKTELGYFINFVIANEERSSRQIELFERFSQTISLMMIDVANMLKEIKEKTNVVIDMTSSFGIIIHLIMSFPRWKSGDFVKETNSKNYIEQNKEIYNIIKKYILEISKKHEIRIPEDEILAIMRYLV